MSISCTSRARTKPGPPGSRRPLKLMLQFTDSSLWGKFVLMIEPLTTSETCDVRQNSATETCEESSQREKPHFNCTCNVTDTIMGTKQEKTPEREKQHNNKNIRCRTLQFYLVGWVPEWNLQGQHKQHTCCNDSSALATQISNSSLNCCFSLGPRICMASIYTTSTTYQLVMKHLSLCCSYLLADVVLLWFLMWLAWLSLAWSRLAW